MKTIETKYFGYRKLCRILRPTTKTYMNTTTTNVLASTVTAGIFAGVIGIAVTGSSFAGAAIGVSYLTVAAVIAMAASDYRTSPRAYFAAPVVKGHFQASDASTAALRRPAAKTRLAA
jgi:predicted lipid-binding transport protein (Tim44 family)